MNPAVSLAILIFNVTISNNLCSSKTVMHLVTAGVQNCFFSSTKSGVEQNKVFTFNSCDVASFITKKLVAPENHLYLFIYLPDMQENVLLTATVKQLS